MATEISQGEQVVNHQDHSPKPGIRERFFEGKNKLTSWLSTKAKENSREALTLLANGSKDDDLFAPPQISSLSNEQLSNADPLVSSEDILGKKEKEIQLTIEPTNEKPKLDTVEDVMFMLSQTETDLEDQVKFPAYSIERQHIEEIYILLKQQKNTWDQVQWALQHKAPTNIRLPHEKALADRLSIIKAVLEGRNLESVLLEKDRKRQLHVLQKLKETGLEYEDPPILRGEGSTATVFKAYAQDEVLGLKKPDVISSLNPVVVKISRGVIWEPNGITNGTTSEQVSETVSRNDQGLEDEESTLQRLRTSQQEVFPTIPSFFPQSALVRNDGALGHVQEFMDSKNWLMSQTLTSEQLTRAFIRHFQLIKTANSAGISFHDTKSDDYFFIPGDEPTADRYVRIDWNLTNGILDPNSDIHFAFSLFLDEIDSNRRKAGKDCFPKEKRDKLDLIRKKYFGKPIDSIINTLECLDELTIDQIEKQLA